MSEVPLFRVASLTRSRQAMDRPTVQGYLAHKKMQPPRTLQYGYALGPMMVLGEGGGFLRARYPCSLAHKEP